MKNYNFKKKKKIYLYKSGNFYYISGLSVTILWNSIKKNDIYFVKLQIQYMEGISLDQQQLLFTSKLLFDDYGICNLLFDGYGITKKVQYSYLSLI